MDMKKIYIAPEIEILEFSSLLLNPVLGVSGNKYNDNDENFDGEAVGESRGDWDNIWNN